MDFCKLWVQGDSKLIIRKVNGEFALKRLLSRLICLLFRSCRSFSHIHSITYSPSKDRHADDLATLASKIDIPGEAIREYCQKDLMSHLIPTIPLKSKSGILTLFKTLFGYIQLRWRKTRRISLLSMASFMLWH